MNNKETIVNNQRGVTIIEMIISIAVGAIVLSMLMQMLSMNILAQRKMDYDNRMFNDSYKKQLEQRYSTYNPIALN